MKKDPIVIVGCARTPMGAFMGDLKSLSAPELGAVAIRAAVERAGVKPEQVQEAILGNVLPAGQVDHRDDTSQSHRGAVAGKRYPLFDRDGECCVVAAPRRLYGNRLTWGQFDPVSLGVDAHVRSRREHEADGFLDSLDVQSRARQLVVHPRPTPALG